MRLEHHEFWTVLHGMLFGAVYLLSFSGGIVALIDLGLKEQRKQDQRWIDIRMRRLILFLWVMALVSWLTVLSGLYVYTWYRAPVPLSPRSQLLSHPETAAWHSLGMEWKEHVAFIALILTTTVAVLVTRCRQILAHRPRLRLVVLVLFVLSFLAALIPGAFGAFINKAAPMDGRTGVTVDGSKEGASHGQQ